MGKNKSILKKQLLSEIIDLILCTIPSFISYFYLKSELKNLNFFYILSIVYLIYILLSTFMANCQTIGNIIQKITLINTKTGKKSKFTFLLISIIKIMAIFLLADLKNINIIYLINIILLLFPIKIVSRKYIYYSFLYFGLKATYVNLEDLI